MEKETEEREKRKRGRTEEGLMEGQVEEQGRGRKGRDVKRNG